MVIGVISSCHKIIYALTQDGAIADCQAHSVLLGFCIGCLRGFFVGKTKKARVRIWLTAGFINWLISLK